MIILSSPTSHHHRDRSGHSSGGRYQQLGPIAFRRAPLIDQQQRSRNETLTRVTETRQPRFLQRQSDGSDVVLGAVRQRPPHTMATGPTVPAQAYRTTEGPRPRLPYTRNDAPGLTFQEAWPNFPGNGNDGRGVHDRVQSRLVPVTYSGGSYQATSMPNGQIRESCEFVRPGDGSSDELPPRKVFLVQEPSRDASSLQNAAAMNETQEIYAVHASAYDGRETVGARPYRIARTGNAFGTPAHPLDHGDHRMMLVDENARDSYGSVNPDLFQQYWPVEQRPIPRTDGFSKRSGQASKREGFEQDQRRPGERNTECIILD